MQIFLSNPFKGLSVNPVSTVDFTGDTLRFNFKGATVKEIPATPGESYYVLPDGLGNEPTVKMANMPEARGKKILWALDFNKEDKQASSFEDFERRFIGMVEENGIHSVCSMSYGNYAFLLSIKKRGTDSKMVPTLGWISDGITEEKLGELFNSISMYRKVRCGYSFLCTL